MQGQQQQDEHLHHMSETGGLPAYHHGMQQQQAGIQDYSYLLAVPESIVTGALSYDDNLRLRHDQYMQHHPQMSMMSHPMESPMDLQPTSHHDMLWEQQTMHQHQHPHSYPQHMDPMHLQLHHPEPLVQRQSPIVEHHTSPIRDRSRSLGSPNQRHSPLRRSPTMERDEKVNPIIMLSSAVTTPPDTQTEVVDPEGPTMVYRNLFITVECNLHRFAGGESFEGQRVYVDADIAYSGNATRYKRVPDPYEKAFLLMAWITDPNGNPLVQCKACNEYYDHHKFFKSNPQALGRMVLVKSNAPISVEGDTFKLSLKIMCACEHHNVPYFNYNVSLRKSEDNSICYMAQTKVFVKQWRKTNQTKHALDVHLYPTAPLSPSGTRRATF
ncbi:hypothetical protein PROFUN_07214 [Planoprotostelium fungivorum]|uniref:Uncharacterized protein n=1 Tax=Planoprotostelium fungivorum TaxID=1890364 RepID=A0A2P6NMG4_9EUKA|nr:hypothetical protein PROFUN_07214 [Planoprotostelium fungivorum]